MLQGLFHPFDLLGRFNAIELARVLLVYEIQCLLGYGFGRLTLYRKGAVQANSSVSERMTRGFLTARRRSPLTP